ncbi:TatD family hydrolase [Dolosicoccus paucivorans]
MYINAHEHLSHYPTLQDGLRPDQITLANTMNEEDFLSTYSMRGDTVFVGYGIHPWEVTEETSLETIESFVKQADFIGEVGLDYLWAKDKKCYPKQREVFEHFVKLSKKHHKFLNIHTKDAEEDVLALLQKYPEATGIIHWYSGPLELVEDFLNLGYYFTISVDAGYSSLTDQLIDLVPLNRLLTETDGPGALEWVNGQIGSPDYIPVIIDYIAKRKGLSFNEVKEVLYQNMVTLLKEYHLVNGPKNI